MLVIGENIHIISPKVKAAIEEKDAGFFKGLAKRQAEAGAGYVELNIGPSKKRGVEIMEWLVSEVEGEIDVPLSLDTTNADAIEAGLKLCKRMAMINSTSAEVARMDRLFPHGGQVQVPHRRPHHDAAGHSDLRRRKGRVGV